MPAISMKVNGKAVSGNVENRTLLVDFIRTNLGLTGTHVGCDTSQCGACVVHIDGKAVKSCTTLAVACEGAMLQPSGSRTAVHPMQEAFRGITYSAVSAPRHGHGSIDIVAGLKVSEEVRRELSGKPCRCTGYHNIGSVQSAAGKM
jgi:carbon-monoxide dehydrogenase small subunit